VFVIIQQGIDSNGKYQEQQIHKNIDTIQEAFHLTMAINEATTDDSICFVKEIPDT
jgi:hypothetical protein